MKPMASVTLVALAAALAHPGTVAAQTAGPSRYQIGQMERVLEGAVEHGAKQMRDRLQRVLPTETTLLTDNARVRGFHLQGYGVFFDVVVPSLLETLPWTFRTLDQNNLGLDNALQALRAAVRSSADPGLQQALARVELQLGPAAAAAAAPTAKTTARPAGVAADSAGDDVLQHPEQAYRMEVKQALMDAMLDHSSSLALGPDEWLTVAARRSADRPELAPADSDADTLIIRLKGSDLAAFLDRQISRDDALKRMDVLVF